MARKLAFTLIVFLILVVILEVGAHLFESVLTESEPGGKGTGWQTAFFGSIFDWHEPDPDLLWRLKANLHNQLIKTNEHHCLGGPITDKKASGTYRILLLGDSSPVGLGLSSYEQTFGALLEHMLKVAYLDKGEVELINAAVSGYTSEQIKRQLELHLWELEPDLVLLYCGNNDASISGYHSDRELLDSQRLQGIRRALGHLALYRILRSLIGGVDGKPPAQMGALRLRVSAEEYRENLASIARTCRCRGTRLIIINPPTPRLWPAGLQFKPFRHVTGEDGQIILPEELSEILGRKAKYCLNQELFASLYGYGDKFTRTVFASAYQDSLAAGEAVTQYMNLLVSKPDDPILLNNLGVSYWQNGQYGEADSILRLARAENVRQSGGDRTPMVVAAGSPILYNIGINLLSDPDETGDEKERSKQEADVFLDSALQADYFSLRIKQDYCEAIDSVGKQNGVQVLDLPTVFEANGGEGLFIDHCHPTAEGHLLIARELAEMIVRLRR